MAQRIAIIGTGISGLVAAHVLHRAHDVTLFEASDEIGGHTCTVDVETDSGPRAVDTGFVVYNERTYPNFTRLLDILGVPSQPTEMSFSVRCEKTDLEYRGSSLGTLFAQQRNLVRLSFYRMIFDIIRFNREAKELLRQGVHAPTLGNLFQERRYSRQFVDHYIVPMGAAIWSSSPSGMLQFPASFFVRFFDNHGLLGTQSHLRWRVVRGGSRNYVDALIRPFRERVRVRTPVWAVRRTAGGVDVETAAGEKLRFDHVIVATHSDQALQLLADATPREREVLGGFEYQVNSAVLHNDRSFLPRRKKAWASWNYHIPEAGHDRVSVTYDMSRLQGLDTREPLCVTLNRDDDVDPDRVLRRLEFAHPVFTTRSVEAQRRHDEISGVERTHYCGAYWGNGFHEDGVNSALKVCSFFGEGLS